MALVAAAVVPHSPLLIPAIAKDHQDRSTNTRQVLRELGSELYSVQPDTVVFLTPHGQHIPSTIVAEVADQVTGTLAEFGDLTTSLTVSGAVSSAHRLKELAEDADIPLMLQTGTGLDYGLTVPWVTMWSEPMPWSALVLSLPVLPFDEAIRLGRLLRDFFLTERNRFALLASGDTSRRPPSMTDADRRPTTIERRWSEAIVQNDVSRMDATDETPLPCLYTPLTTALACLQTLPAHGRVRSFEVPLTVGQLVADWQLSP